MMARKKPLNVVEPAGAPAETTADTFEKPAPRGAVKLVDSVDELIDLLTQRSKSHLTLKRKDYVSFSIYRIRKRSLQKNGL